MHFVKSIPDGRTEYFTDHTLLLDALLEMGIDIKTPCGGKGICGKCIVPVKGKLSGLTET
ncbi:MAG: 2Fe-2S iron-sulfur cluster binding domain-containing protein, partial [Deltaproteobacteria bacterium]|nr:2Fe-2S iron-sulfur cluster binding domain-containing protein [Deltaproteobacteria bacterium]